MSPSTRPSTSGAIGYFIARSTKPSRPKASITSTSNRRLAIANEPIVQSTKISGISRSRGTART